MNFQKVVKKKVNEDSFQADKDLQSSLAWELVTSQSPQMLCILFNKGQTTLQTGFDLNMSTDICRSNDA